MHQQSTYYDWPRPPQPPMPHRQWPLVVAGALAGVLATSVLVGVGVLLASGRLGPSSASGASAEHAAPVIDELARMAAYRTVLSTDGTKLADDLTAAGTACSKSFDSPACLTAVQKADDTVHQFQTDLSQHPAPTCLASADTQLRSALTDLDRALQDTLTAIDQTNFFLLSQADTELRTSTQEVQAWQDAFNATQCPTA